MSLHWRKVRGFTLQKGYCALEQDDKRREQEDKRRHHEQSTTASQIAKAYEVLRRLKMIK